MVSSSVSLLFLVLILVEAWVLLLSLTVALPGSLFLYFSKKGKRMDKAGVAGVVGVGGFFSAGEGERGPCWVGD